MRVSIDRLNKNFAQRVDFLPSSSEPRAYGTLKDVTTVLSHRVRLACNTRPPRVCLSVSSFIVHRTDPKSTTPKSPQHRWQKNTCRLPTTPFTFHPPSHVLDKHRRKQSIRHNRRSAVLGDGRSTYALPRARRIGCGVGRRHGTLCLSWHQSERRRIHIPAFTFAPRAA